MRINFHLRWLKTALLAALTLALVEGYDFIRKDGQVVIWNPGAITMQIKMATSPALIDGTNYAASVQTAMTDWNAVIGAVQFSPQITPIGPAGDGNSVNEIVFDSTIYGDAFDSNTLAVTLSYRSGTPRSDGTFRRTQSDIIFNTAFTWDSYRGALLPNKEDIRRVALHELGHVLGLGHPDEAGQAVSAIMNSFESNTGALQADDIAGAQFLYGTPVPAGPVAPAIVTQPVSRVVNSGASVTFIVVASGTPTLTYQWQKDGAEISGATSSNFFIASVAPGDAGSYRVVVTNAAGAVTSNVAVLGVNEPPVITSQPVNQVLNVGDDAQFSVTASGTAPLVFQWKRNGAALSNSGNVAGANSATLQITNAQSPDAGNYSVDISNSAGVISSNPAALGLIALPQLTSRPSSALLHEGQSASFSVAVAGTEPLFYQWRHNQKIITGVTGATLALQSVDLSARGYYEVIVTNAAGGVARSVFYVAVAIENPGLVTWGDYAVTPPPITGSVAEVAMGGAFLALKGDGTVVAWGDNGSGLASIPAGLSGVVAVAAGSSFSLALRSDGTVVSWGSISGPPVGLSGVVAIAAGPYHALALQSDGTLVGWGNESYGQSTIPIGLKNIVAIKTGRFQSLVLKADGTVSRWGYYGFNTTPSYGPSLPANLANVVAIANGDDPSLALKADGTVVAWGTNYADSAVVPVGLNNVVDIAAGESFALALKSDGTVVGWGRNYEHQATPPVGLSGVVAVVAQDWRNMAILRQTAPVIELSPDSKTAVAGDYVEFSVAESGTIPFTFQWRKDGTNLSDGNGVGGTHTSKLVFADVQALDAGSYDVVVANVAGVATSTPALLAVKQPPVFTQRPMSQLVAVGDRVVFSAQAVDNGTINYQWRHNGQAIPGATGANLVLAAANLGDGGFYEVVAANSIASTRSTFSLLVSTIPVTRATVVGWGGSGYGENQPPLDLDHVVAVAAGRIHAIALRDDGTIRGWGANSFGALSPPAELSDVVGVAAGEYHTLALRANGIVVSWGNYFGSPPPMPADLRNVVAISAKRFSNIALRSDGTVVTWGMGSTPEGLSGVVAISAGVGHGLALRGDGTVVAWGRNDNGQATVPLGLRNVIAIAAGEEHSLALKADGTVVAWGRNDVGQAAVPVELGGVVAISGGFVHSIALKRDGTVVGWGRNNEGEGAGSSSVSGLVGIASGSYFNLGLTPSSPPSIINQPIGNAGQIGESAAFRVTASGTALFYQWRKGGINLSDGDRLAGATSSVLTIRGLTAGDSDRYDVVVTNSLGSVTSVPATLTVNIPPLFTQRPLTRLVTVGSAVSLTAGLDGASGVAFQWRHNGRIVSGANGPTLSFASVGLGDRGSYQLIASNSVATSSTIFWLDVTSSQTDNLVVRGWGSNVAYESSDRNLTGVVALAAGKYGSLALKDDGTLVAWGVWSAPQGRIDLFSASLRNVVAMKTGFGRVLALRADGTVESFGNYADDSSVTQFLTGVVDIATTFSYNYALRSDGTLVRWTAASFLPSRLETIVGPSDTVQISGGQNFVLALRANGLVSITGDAVPYLFVVGEGVDSQLSVPAGLSDVVTVAAGHDFCVALKSNGTVVAWGPSYSPGTQIPTGLSEVVAISANDGSGLLLKADGTVVRWGQVLNGSSNTPPQEINSAVVAIASGAYHNLVLRNAPPNRAPSITLQPVNSSALIGGGTTFAVAATGSPTPSFQWQGLAPNGSIWFNVGNLEIYTPGAHYVPPTYSGMNDPVLHVSSSMALSGFRFRCVVTNVTGSITSNEAILTVAAPLPVITTNPESILVALGSPINLSAAATSPVALSYQWRKDGVDISGANSTSYSIASVQPADTGSYTVVVTNSAGSVTSATATVAIATLPIISAQPVSRSVVRGDGFNFAVTASSSVALNYQWKKDGAAILGATLSNYSKLDAQPSDEGSYTVEVSNAAGTVTSNPALLTVTGAMPVITQQPQSATALIARPAPFTVGATGAPLPSFQWQRMVPGGSFVALSNGGVYSGATTSILIINSTSTAMNGDQFRCVVSNVLGAAISDPATLTVAAPGFTKFSTGRYHSLRLDATSQLYATGMNSFGQLGNGTTTTTATPQLLTTAGPRVVDIAAGAQHSLILTSAKELWATGFNGNGQLGDGTLAAKSTPVRIATGVAGMAAAVFHSAFIKSDGTLWLFGGNDSGQLGNGTTADSLAPVQVATGVVDVALGNRQSFFLKSDGTLWGMGDMNGSGVAVSTPVQIATNVRAVTAGAYHSLFIKSDGTLWCLGYNVYGQLGNGTTTGSPTPVQIATGVNSISAGYFHSLFIKTDNTLWATGNNGGGQLGDGTTAARSTPFQVATGVVAVSASESYTLFSKSDGSLWATGYNANGQFGNGSTTTTSAPVQLATGSILAPDVPTAVTATPSVTLDRMHLTWQPTVNATSYEVWRNTTNDSIGATRLATGVRWSLFQDLTSGNGTVYSYWIKAVNATGTSAFSASASGSFTPLAPPTITIQPLTQTVNLGASVTFSVAATGTTPFTYQWRRNSVSIPAANSASYSITSAASTDAGSYDVVVTNAVGTATSNAASLSVNKLSQAIAFTVPAQISYSTDIVPLTATASSGLTVSLFIVSGPAVLADQNLLLNNIGTVVVRASQAGNEIYGPAPVVEQAIAIVPAVSTLSFWAPTLTRVYNGAAFAPTVNSNPVVALSLTFDGSNTVPKNAGTYTVVATSADPRYSGSATATYTIERAAQNIYGPVSYPTYPFTPPEGPTFSLAASAAGGPVNFSVGSGRARLSGLILTATGAGTIVLHGSQGGSQDYLPAPDQIWNIIVAKAAQTIAFTGPANQSFSAAPITLSATASSGLPVSFSVVSGPASVTGNSLTLTGSGTVTLRASQAGDANYLAAPAVDQSFTVAGNFASWQREKFTAPELADPAISGPNADPDGDDLSNLTEYALGLEPKQPTTTGLPESSVQGADWAYAYSRPSDRADLTYAVEVSTDLATWTTTGVTLELVTTANGTETWRARFPLSGGTTVFFRLKITRL